jgi:TolB-like protein
MNYLFEDFALDSERRELRRGVDVIAAEPQVFDLLEYLIRHRERVVSKDDLLTAIWHGRSVSESTLTTRINSARAAIGDSGDRQRLIKTLRSKGFRFVGTVREEEHVPSAGVNPVEKPSIAVLPFDNMSDAAEDVYFADGIAEDIITELSRYPDLFVVARNSSFTYRGKAARVTDVARELGARYVLEGSVRRAGNRVRINAQLIDAASGTHLWAQRYDRSLEDLFSVQDEVTQNIVAVLPARVQTAALEHASRKISSSLDAYDYLLRGKYCFHLETPDANREAEAHFDRAIELDPRFASAYAWKACTIGQAVGKEFLPRTLERLQQSIELVERAMSIDENDSECHRIMCRIALMQGQYAKSEHHLERALALNPNDPRLVVQRGINLTFLGDPEAAIPWIERAMRLDPFSAHRYYLDLVRALFMAERTTEAVAILERTARAHWEHYLWLAACYAAVSEDSAAQQTGRKATALRPNLSVTTYVEGLVLKRDEDKARLCTALARAGLPR